MDSLSSSLCSFDFYRRVALITVHVNVDSKYKRYLLRRISLTPSNFKAKVVETIGLDGVKSFAYNVTGQNTSSRQVTFEAGDKLGADFFLQSRASEVWVQGSWG